MSTNAKNTNQSDDELVTVQEAKRGPGFRIDYKRAGITEDTDPRGAMDTKSKPITLDDLCAENPSLGRDVSRARASVQRLERVFAELPDRMAKLAVERVLYDKARRATERLLSIRGQVEVVVVLGATGHLSHPATWN